MGFFDLTEQEQRSFLSVVRHTVIEGPLRLVRFSDSTRGHVGAYGAYWMYAIEVAEILRDVASSGPYGLKTIRAVSNRWAICDDWGDLGRMWIMNIPAGSTLNAYFGFAKFQPKISTEGQKSSARSTNNSYPGGSIQLVTRIGEQEKRWITGPFRTIDVSANTLAG